jgi:proteasome lid subunit RPN8/RPN11
VEAVFADVVQKMEIYALSAEILMKTVNKLNKQKPIMKRKTKMKNRNNYQKNQKPILRFSPTAWAKLLFMRDMTGNEVGGFGITEADDLLFVTDFALVKQKVSCVSVSFDDESVADFFEDQVLAGRRPEQFARIWLHTHPGDSPEPSMTDEATFARVFGSCDWSVMCIVAQDGSTFARLRFNAGPGGEIKIPVCVDYGCEFDAANFDLWKQQYKGNVSQEEIFKPADNKEQAVSHKRPCGDLSGTKNFGNFPHPQLSSDDLIAEIDQMDPIEREIFMEELSVRSDFWNEEGEVLYG